MALGKIVRTETPVTINNVTDSFISLLASFTMLWMRASLNFNNDNDIRDCDDKKGENIKVVLPPKK